MPPGKHRLVSSLILAWSEEVSSSMGDRMGILGVVDPSFYRASVVGWLNHTAFSCEILTDNHLSTGLVCKGPSIFTYVNSKIKFSPGAAVYSHGEKLMGWV